MVKFQKGINDLETWCIKNNAQQILDEWDYYENEKDSSTPNSPGDIYYRSKDSVHWVCSYCGSKNYSPVVNHLLKNKDGSYYYCHNCWVERRSKGRHLAAVKKNSLLSVRPDLECEWDYEKNYPLLPKDFSYGSSDEVFWLCPWCGTSWKMRVSARTIKHHGCPNCAKGSTSFQEQSIYYYLSKYYNNVENRYNYSGVEFDVFLLDNNIAIEYDGIAWHRSKLENDNRKDLFCKENKIRLIRIRDNRLPKTEYAECIDCIDSNDASLEKAIKSLLLLLEKTNEDIDIRRDTTEILALYRRNLKDNSLAVKNPELASEWCYELNGELLPENISYKSNKYVWWKCNKCGLIWQSSPNSRSKGSACSNCGHLSSNEKNRVRVINLDTNEIFDSLNDAAASIGVNKATLCGCLRGAQKTSGGYHWGYLDSKDLRESNYTGKIINLDTKEVFESPKDAAKSCNGDARNIVQSCKGKTKKSYGYRWAFYLDEQV